MSNLEQIIRPFTTGDVTPLEVHPAGAVAAPPVLLQLGRKGATKVCGMSYSASSSTYIAEQWGVAEVGFHVNTVHQVDPISGVRTGSVLTYNVIEWVAYQSINGGIKVVTSAGSNDKGGPNTDVGVSQTQMEIPWPFPLKAPTGGVGVGNL